MDVRGSQRLKLLLNVVYDKEYQGYVVDVPQLPGCMSQGKTIETALKNARKVIRLYLKASANTVLPPLPEVMTGQIEVTI